MRMLAVAVVLCGVCNCIAAESTSVPLTKVLTTSRQQGMRHVKEEFATKGADAVENAKTIKRLAVILNSSGGASNVFLVNAENIADAIQAGSNVMVSSHSARTPASLNGSHAGKGSYWLVANLGVGAGSPDRWVVDGITVSGNTVRFSYREPKAGIRTLDMLSYYYWAPLGKLEPGTYQVELYDADEKAVTLIRRVVVEPSK
jgi:hypothetical protein